MTNIRKMTIGGLSVAALVGGLVATTTPASAVDRYATNNGYVVGDTYVNGGEYGDNHYSRKHPDGLAFDQGPVGAAGNVVGGAAAGVGVVVGGTLDGAAGVAAGVTGGPYRHRVGPAYYQGGQQYVRRGAYLYPVGPGAGQQIQRY